ncbi:MAG: hypothetical protein A2Z20_00815 [Bdellovibrionales bacterium RBG_16_40_8]|nr:MAG: hypothetical protein A2Z20_00815 [Bdellovibrionales bacterium RBG_16_40_8]
MRISWREVTLVGFDLETSGKYPLEAEICEIAAVKWRDNKIVDSMQSFVTTSRPMSKEVIAIHNITNEMLVGAPKIAQGIKQLSNFIGDAYMIAHHAPFDMGFLAPEFERINLPLPKNPVFCSSLLSRKAYPESKNHKLQTLIEFFELEKGQAHRAFDDAKACLEIGMKTFTKSQDQSIAGLLDYQGVRLLWSDYTIEPLKANSVFATVIKAIKNREMVQIVYMGGSRPGEARTVFPIGLVRNPLDDYLVAKEEQDQIPKRYFLKKIKAARF